MNEIEFEIDGIPISNHHAKSLAPVYARAFRMIERVRVSGKTHIGAAKEIEVEAAGDMVRFGQLLDHLGGEQSEVFSIKMGWPSRDALLDYQMHGVALHALDS